ncbi:MAG: hypothetical protein Q4D98_12040 [Planctomycetia bacterium]|nr:hypothetical protein [Planctomycetia bacterium]
MGPGVESLYAQRGGGNPPAMGRPAGGAPSRGRPVGGNAVSSTPNRSASRATPSRAERPANRPAERPAARAPERTVNRPAERPAKRTVNRPAERPAERPAARAPERTVNRPAERPAERTVNRPAERPAEPRQQANRAPASREGSSVGRPMGGYDVGRPMGGGERGPRPESNPNRTVQRREPSRVSENVRPPERREPSYRDMGRREPPRNAWAGGHPGDPHHRHPGFMPPPPPPGGGPGHHPWGGPGHYDPHPWHSRPGYYRPVYPWWVGIAQFGAGLAIGYRMGAWEQPYYYYYPEYVVPTNGQTVVYENNTTIVVQEPQGAVAAAEPMEQPVLDSVLEPIPITQADTGQQSILRKDLNLSSDQNFTQITKEQIDDSWKTIQEADTLFAAGKSTEAVKNYRQVAEAMEGMPDPWFRLSVAEMSLKDYSSAMDNCLKGMEAAKQWPSSPFSLDYMYQGDQARKSADLAAMDRAVAASPDNSDLQLLAGVMYYSDGQTDKATASLQRAKAISADLETYVDPMLKNIEESGKIENQ